MLQMPRTLFCVGASGLIREVTAIAPASIRVRWSADLAAYERAIKGSSTSGVAGCLVALGDEGVATLTFTREANPTARRLVIADACDLKMVRELLESGNATDLLYRPLDTASLNAALGITSTPPAVPIRRTPTTAASRG